MKSGALDINGWPDFSHLWREKRGRSPCKMHRRDREEKDKRYHCRLEETGGEENHHCVEVPLPYLVSCSPLLWCPQLRDKPMTTWQRHCFNYLFMCSFSSLPLSSSIQCMQKPMGFSSTPTPCFKARFFSVSLLSTTSAAASPNGDHTTLNPCTQTSLLLLFRFIHLGLRHPFPII